jgi:NAD(P)-dependent dehydrogenase (short-subunit alcohol dehydrogenase family)
MLQGKRILITGSSQGIGKAAGLAMAAHGARVAFTSERPVDFVLPAGCPYLQCDLTQPEVPELLIRQSIERLGGLDVLVNNVGTFREPEFLQIQRSDFDAVFGLNVWTAIALTREFVRQCPGGGRILFSTSLNAVRSEPGHTLYDASKAAIDALTRQLAIELAPKGFTTAAIAPGLVETPLTDFGLRSDPAARQAVMAQIPIGRIATVDDLAMWYVFLASDAARYSTGSIIRVDGGLDAQQMSLRPVTAAERHSG